MEEKDIWLEYIEREEPPRFDLDKMWVKYNSDNSRERLRLVRYPNTDKYKVQSFYSKIIPDAMVTWDDGTEEMSYREIDKNDELLLMSEAFAKYFGDGDNEFTIINSIEDLYEI